MEISANLLSDVLKQTAGDRVRIFLARFTPNRFSAVGAGIATTTVLDSSSVTIILLISLVNAGLLTFEHSLAVIMGSNIGTTISSQLFAFDIDEYSPVILALGLLAQVLGPGDSIRSAGRIIFAFGLVFFGLHYIGRAVEPLRDHKPLLEWLQRVENPIYGAAVGALFTTLIQSSSATMGIVITMASGGMISLPAGVALMLGADWHVHRYPHRHDRPLTRSDSRRAVSPAVQCGNCGGGCDSCYATRPRGSVDFGQRRSGTANRHGARAIQCARRRDVIGLLPPIVALMRRLIPDREHSRARTHPGGPIPEVS